MPVKGLSLNEASKTNHAGTSNRLARLGWEHKRIVLLFGVESEGWGEIVPGDGKLHSGVAPFATLRLQRERERS